MASSSDVMNSFSMTNRSNEIKVGMLTKRAQQMKSYTPVNFKERVFVLTPEKLTYYEGTKEKRGKAKGSIKLNEMSYIGTLHDDALLRTSAFQIQHKSAYLYCCAKSIEDRSDWIVAIRRACSDAGVKLKDSTHPRIYRNGKWQCCNQSNKSAEGCTSDGADSSSSKAHRLTANYNYHKPLPALPPPDEPALPPPPVARRTVLQEQLPPIPVERSPAPMAPVQPNYPPPTPTCEEYIAKYDYEPQQTEDIRLVRGKVYRVLDQSKEHWWRVRERSSGSVGCVPASYLRPKPTDGEEYLADESWFAADIHRTRAEDVLRRDDREGCFLVRKSQKIPGLHTLSLLSRGGMVNGPPEVKHYSIQRTADGKYFLAQNHVMANIAELINYHRHNAGGLVTRLRHPPRELSGDSDECRLLSDGSGWAIDVSTIRFGKLLGSGQFGEVKQGWWHDRLVAVKVMKENSMEESAFIEEAEMMAKLQHPNLVQLYGVTQTRPICIVTEFMEHGCLLDYIRSNLQYLKYPEFLLDFAAQICDAMRYLEHENVIHRDLAARNCLVNSSNQVKVADFGLSRFVLEDEYTSSVGAKFPIKWSAVEVLQYTQFSTKSDVWAFGILIWELFSGGKTPYPGMSNNEVLEFVDKHDRRLERPHDCPHEVYVVMRKTWHKDKDKRPTFASLYTTLCNLIDSYNMDCRRIDEDQF